MTALVREQDAALALLGGKRAGIPPAPSPEELARHLEAEAAKPPRELTDRELGLAPPEFGELGIPERRVKGVGAAQNFTVGPTFIYKGAASIAELTKRPEPVVLVATYITEEEYRKIDRTRVRGVVFEKGSVVDPMYWFLRDENRAAVIAAEGALELARNDEPCVVDGVRGVAYFGPCPKTVEDYGYLRSLGPPPEDPLLKATFRQLATSVMGSRFRDQKAPPFEFLEYDRLMDIARRARKGLPITKDDDMWMQGILLQGFPTPEEMIAKAKKPTEIGKKDKDEAKADAPARGARGRGDAAEGGAKDDAGSKDGAAKDDAAEGPKSAAESRRAQREAEIAAARASRHGEAPAEAKKEPEKPAAEDKPARAAPAEKPPEKAPEKPAEKPADAKSDKESAAEARRAQREAEIAAARAARHGGKDKPKEGEKAAEPSKDAAPSKDEAKPSAAADDFDPLGDMM